MFNSKCFLFSIIRSNPNSLSFKVTGEPSKTSSLTTLPTSGDCWIPCPLNPLTKTKFLITGCAPIIPF